jgi:hypothetical protein
LLLRRSRSDRPRSRSTLRRGPQRRAATKLLTRVVRTWCFPAEVTGALRERLTPAARGTNLQLLRSVSGGIARDLKLPRERDGEKLFEFASSDRSSGRRRRGALADLSDLRSLGRAQGGQGTGRGTCRRRCRAFTSGLSMMAMPARREPSRKCFKPICTSSGCESPTSGKPASVRGTRPQF